MKDEILKVRMTASMKRWIDQEAARRDVSASQVVRELVAAAIERGAK